MISIIFLAIIQGISEFLPISSSFHLIIFRDIFLIGKDIISSDIELTFDIALHLGTAIAIILYFFNDFCYIFKNNKRMLNNIIIATIPGAFFGLFLDDFVESYIRSKYNLITISFILMGIIIYLTDKYNKEIKDLNNISLKDSFLIGLFQVFALIPGFSRSGTTISSARFLNINRKDAAVFSFYLSAPIILGASILQLLKTDTTIIINNFNIFIIGLVTSFIVGLWIIRFLLNYIRKKDYKIFMWYRLIFGIIIIIYLLKSI